MNYADSDSDCHVWYRLTVEGNYAGDYNTEDEALSALTTRQYESNQYSITRTYGSAE